MSNIGFRIILSDKRPDQALVEAFRGLPVANIDDCMNRMAAVSPAIRPFNKTPLLGTAFTVRCPEGDNLMFHKAMDLAKPGDVLVIAAGGDESRSLCGALMMNYCKVRGLAGVIVDGSVRDAEDLNNLDFPVYARGIIPNGPYKNGPGEIGVPVAFGGQVIFPGDILVGDADGIVVVRPEDAEEIAKAARAVLEKETKTMNQIVGEHKNPRPWVDEKLAAGGCEIIEES